MLLDCTLRDGSYAVNFSFSESETKKIVLALAKSGLRYIEVGHGVGIGASSTGIEALCSDKQYAKAAVASKGNSKVGMFAIGGVAKPSQVMGAVEEGLDFLRVGVTPDTPQLGVELIEAAKQQGVEVFVNFMKSYTSSREALAQQVDFCLDAGADGLYLVDSAGGMLPDTVRGYAEALAERRGSRQLKLGFHGHDNLGLAVWNSLVCIDSGFDIVDCTLQGLGRSAGNAPTERIAGILAKRGDFSEVNLPDLCQISDSLIRPRMGKAGTSGLDTFAGYSEFHSSYMDALLTVSQSAHVSPYELMKAHTAMNKLTASVPELETTAKSLPEATPKPEISYADFLYRSGDQ